MENTVAATIFFFSLNIFNCLHVQVVRICNWVVNAWNIFFTTSRTIVVTSSAPIYLCTCPSNTRQQGVRHEHAEPHGSVRIAQDLRTEGHWSDPHHCNRIHSSLTAVHCFNNDNVGNWPVAWIEYCAEYWLEDLQESMNRCTGCRILCT